MKSNKVQNPRRNKCSAVVREVLPSGRVPRTVFMLIIIIIRERTVN